MPALLSTSVFWLALTASSSTPGQPERAQAQPLARGKATNGLHVRSGAIAQATTFAHELKFRLTPEGRIEMECIDGDARYVVPGGRALRPRVKP